MIWRGAGAALAVLAAVCALGWTGAAFAQTAAQQAAPVQTSLAQAASGQFQSAQSSLAPFSPASSSVAPSSPALAPQPQPPAAASADQTITGVELDGVTLFSKARLTALVAPWRGRPVTFSNIGLIAKAIKAAYRRRGYDFVATVVPPQKIVGGRVRIIVLEGKVDRLDYIGRDVVARRQAAAVFVTLKAKRPVAARDLEDAYQRAALVPGLTVTSAIGPSSAEGGLSLLLNPVRRPWDSFASVSNGYGEALGRWAVSAGLSYAGAATHGEKTALQLVAAPDIRRLLSADLDYRRGLDAAGTVLALDIAASKANPSAAAAPLEITSSGYSAEAQISRPLLLRSDLHLFAALTFDASDQTVRVFSETALSHDRVRDLSGRLSGDAVFPFGRGEGWLELRKGLGVLGASRAGSPDISHPGADPEAVIVRGSAAFNTASMYGFGAELRYQFQEAERGLLVADQFSAGNSTIVRGYDPGTVTADRAQAYGVTVRSPALPWVKFARVSLFGFSEGAALETIGPKTAETPVQSRWIASVGGGARLELANGIRVEVTYAAPRKTTNLSPADVVLVSAVTSLNGLAAPLSHLASTVWGGVR